MDGMAAPHAPWRTLLRPTALLSHALVLAVVAVLVTLGQWQLDRLDQRRAVNERFQERADAEALDQRELLSISDPEPRLLEYRRVELEGTYLADEELLLEGRAHQGQTGRHSFVPLQLEDGPLVLVRRGWVPREAGDPPVTEAAPPEGTVRIQGYLERSVTPEGFGPRNPETGELSILQIPDVGRVAEQLPGATYPMFVTLLEQQPPQEATAAQAEQGLPALPIPAGETTFDDEGAHLNYAVQWHSFALLAGIAYAAWWVKRLREERDGPDDTGVAPDARRADATV